MKKFIVLAVAAYVSSAGAVNDAGWAVQALSKGPPPTIVAVDLNNISRSNEYSSIWVMVIQGRDETLQVVEETQAAGAEMNIHHSDPKGSAVLQRARFREGATVYHNQFDCSRDLYRNIGDNMTVSDWSSVEPGSMWSRLEAVACRGA